MIRTAAGLTALALAAAPAMATTDGWPALYDVVGVAADDVLNIRSTPGTSGEIVGTLAHDATSIEVVRPSEDLMWGLVNTGEGNGWISLNFAVPQPGQWDGSLPAMRQCFGTEPFWTLSYDPPRIALTTPEGGTREGLISGIHGSQNHRNAFAFTGAFFPTEAGNRDIHLSVRRADCSDGMSDRAFGLTVDMLVTRPDAGGDDSGVGLFSGCCSIAPPAE